MPSSRHFGKERCTYGESHRLAMLCFWLMAVPVLVGCSGDGDPSGIPSYHERMANVLEVASSPTLPDQNKTAREEAFTKAFISYEEFKRIRERFRYDSRVVDSKRDKASLNVLEFLSLHGCEVQLSIARKNSSLGKFAPDSQALLEALKFVEQGPACVQQLVQEGKDQLANELDLAIDQKRRALPRLTITAILLGEEAQVSWKPERGMGRFADHQAYESLAAVTELQQFSEGVYAEDFEIDSIDFEQALNGLRKAELGNLFLSMLYYSEGIEGVNRLITERVEAGCGSMNAAQMLVRVDNVVHKFFVSGVQVWAAKVNQRFYDLMTIYQSLEQANSDHLPSDYKTWRSIRDALMERSLTISQEHVGALQLLKETCSAR